jgi:hypothetical protein
MKFLFEKPTSLEIEGITSCRLHQSVIPYVVRRLLFWGNKRGRYIFPIKIGDSSWLCHFGMTTILRGQQPPPQNSPKIHQRIVNPRKEAARILLLLGKSKRSHRSKLEKRHTSF